MHHQKNFLRRPGNEIWQVKGLERYHGEDLFLPDILTTEPIAAAEQAVTAGQPFFLYLTHYAVHTPLDADDRFVQKYREYNEGVVEYFADRPDDYLRFDMTKGDGFEQLCPFLGLDIPAEPFPHRNKQESLLKVRMRQVLKKLGLK